MKMTPLRIVLKNGHAFTVHVAEPYELYRLLTAEAMAKPDGSANIVVQGKYYLNPYEVAAIYPDEIDRRSVTDEPEHRQFIHDPNHDRFGWKARLAKQSDEVDSH